MYKREEYFRNNIMYNNVTIIFIDSFSNFISIFNFVFLDYFVLVKKMKQGIRSL